jgi:hypothetical protein
MLKNPVLFFLFSLLAFGQFVHAEKLERVSVQTDLPKSPLVYKYPTQNKIEIDGKALGVCLSLATLEHMSLSPYISLQETNCKYNPTQLLSYLRADRSELRACDYTTTFEAEIIKWVLRQHDNSIDPLLIFQESYSLSGGNVFNAILAIHNVIRNHARYYDTRRYSFPSTKEKSEKFLNKFIDIRGDLSERGASFSGDHAGSWYRIWGIALYRFSLGYDYAWFRDLYLAYVIAYGAEIYKMSANYPESDRSGKIETNKQGARMGNQVFSAIQDPQRLAKEADQWQGCLQKSYLKVHR